MEVKFEALSGAMLTKKLEAHVRRKVGLTQRILSTSEDTPLDPSQHACLAPSPQHIPPHLQRTNYLLSSCFSCPLRRSCN